jgi:hypothetical protein
MVDVEKYLVIMPGKKLCSRPAPEAGTRRWRGFARVSNLTYLKNAQDGSLMPPTEAALRGLCTRIEKLRKGSHQLRWRERFGQKHAVGNAE